MPPDSFSIKEGQAQLVFRYFALMRFAVAIVSPPDRHDISGGAFNEVAEALHYGLVALGHDSVLTNRLDLDECRTIVLGGNLLVQYALEPPKNPIFYNLEQLGDDLPWMRMPEFIDLFRRYPTWDYSQANIEYLATLGLPRPAYVPLGYVPELTRIAPAVEDIDVLFYGALNGRRYTILRDLHDRGLRVKWIPGTYGESRDAWIARSKIVLNLHYFEAKIFAIVRVSYLLANRRAVVSEHSADPSLERDLASGIAFADYDNLVDRCVELVSDEGARRELAERGYQAFSTRDQAAILDRALSDLEAVGHQSAVQDDRCTDVRTEGNDRSADQRLRERQLFTRNLFKYKSAQERDWLLANVKNNPEDARSVFFLAETYFRMEDFVNARKWYTQRVDMGGGEEETYCAMYRLAQSIQQLRSPWADCEDAYLRAWHFRPTRAEPLYAVACAYHDMQLHQVGYLIAQRAAQIPFPEEDLYVSGEVQQVYAWRATDMQATCASRTDRHSEAFTLCRGLLARADIPDPDRQRIAANRDFSVPAMIEAAATYPQTLAQSLTLGPGKASEAEVTVSLIAGPDPQTTEQTLNSFLNCCVDVSRIGCFLVLDTGLSAPDRAELKQRYGFLKFARRKSGEKATAQLAQLRAQIHTRHWLHLGEGWRFFTPEDYITRLTAVLDAEPQVFQVGINFEDAVKLTGASAGEQTIRRAADTGRYLLTETMARGPAMFDTARLDRADGLKDSDPDPPAKRRRPAARARLGTASLDEVLCTSGLDP